MGYSASGGRGRGSAASQLPVTDLEVVLSKKLVRSRKLVRLCSVQIADERFQLSIDPDASRKLQNKDFYEWFRLKCHCEAPDCKAHERVGKQEVVCIS